jgi:hypothetical protein
MDRSEWSTRLYLDVELVHLLEEVLDSVLVLGVVQHHEALILLCDAMQDEMSVAHHRSTKTTHTTARMNQEAIAYGRE